MKIKKDITFWGEVSNGKLKLDNRDKFDKYISTIDGIISLTIKKKKKRRTIPQNSLYWLWITVIGDELGYEPEEMHDTFKSLYNSERKIYTDKSTGEVKELKIIRSTTILGIAEFCDYMNRIERYAAELGIILPNPNNL